MMWESLKCIRCKGAKCLENELFCHVCGGKGYLTDDEARKLCDEIPRIPKQKWKKKNKSK
jgi:hypothetical protein